MAHHHLWLQVYVHLGHLITNFFAPAKNGGAMRTLLAMLPLKARVTMCSYLLVRRAEMSGRPVMRLGAELEELHELCEKGVSQPKLELRLIRCLVQLERLNRSEMPEEPVGSG